MSKPTRARAGHDDAALGISTFAGFADAVLGFNLYPKQREALDALQPLGSLVSFRSCNGGGKTRVVIASAILGHLLLSRGKVISTSGSFRQITDQLTPALHVFANRFTGLDFQQNRILSTDPNSFWDGFSTNEAGKFEGHHGDAGHPLLLIVDEAKTVKDPIFEAIERCRVPRAHCRILFASSAGYAQGEFYRSQTIRAGTLTHPPIIQRSTDCPHISRAEQDALRAKWGSEHPLVKSLLDAEFMPFVEGAVVNLAALDDLLADPPPYQPGQRKYFCDFAWSESGTGDQNVCAKRDGNRITVPLKFRAKGLHAVCARFVEFFTREGAKPWEIEGDADGDGANIIKQLRAMGWAIGSAHNGGQPRWNDHYGNLASEMWCDGAQAIINRSFILPDDLEFYGQALNRKIVPNNRGKMVIESKQAMKDPNREGGAVPESPDVADACWKAGTLIHTANGQVPIESVGVGDLVLTPFGYSRVAELHVTPNKPTIRLESGRWSLEGTENHKVFVVGKGWVRMDAIRLTDTLESVIVQPIWNLLHLLFTRVESIGFKALADIIKTRTGTACRRDFFIESYGLSTTALFLKACASITRIMIGQTTGSRILNWCRTRTMRVITWLKGRSSQDSRSRTESIWTRLLLRLANGTVPRTASSGTESMGELRWRLACEGMWFRNASSAGTTTRLHPSDKGFARSNAATGTSMIERKCSVRAVCAAVISWSASILRRPIVPKSVCRKPEGETVYNLTLEHENAYYANGVLVQNCFGAMSPLPMGTSRRVMGGDEPVKETKDSIWSSRDDYVHEEQPLPGVWIG